VPASSTVTLKYDRDTRRIVDFGFARSDTSSDHVVKQVKASITEQALFRLLLVSDAFNGIKEYRAKFIVEDLKIGSLQELAEYDAEKFKADFQNKSSDNPKDELCEKWISKAKQLIDQVTSPRWIPTVELE